jgi:hypothetical protein
MNEPTPASQLVRKRQLATLLSVSPRTIDGWVAKRMIPFIEPNPRLHLFDRRRYNRRCWLSIQFQQRCPRKRLCEPERVATEADLERCNRLCTRVARFGAGAELT